jgi:Helix-hairpin-helix domain
MRSPTCITRLHRTGTHPSLERMRREIPEGVLEMLSVPGLRPDKVLKLHKQLGIASLTELEAAASQDRIKSMKGLGPALQRKIVQGLAIRNILKVFSGVTKTSERLSPRDHGVGCGETSTSRRRCKVRRLSQVDASAPAIAEGTGSTNAAFATLEGASPAGRARSSEPSAACRVIRADVPRAPRKN